MKIDLKLEITDLTADICLHWHRSNNPTMHHASDEVAIPPAAVRVKIIYPAVGWITSYWPGKENKYDHDVSWHTVASEI